MDREHKIWDNGNKCTIIRAYYDNWDFDFESLIGDAPIGILGCNLRDYSLEHNNDNLKTTKDVFEWAMKEKKVKSFKFTVADLMKAYGSDSYYDYESDEDVCFNANKEYSVEELKDLILNMYDNDCFDDGDIFNIINQTEFERFIIRPFYAYIHSGISVSLGDFSDPWDSGVAGFAWYEPYDDETMEDAERYFKEDFSVYDDYVCGYYNEYHITSFEKKNGEWTCYDDFWSFEKSFEDAWEHNYDKVTDEVKSFTEEDKDLVRREISIDDEEVLDYLTDYLC